MKFAGTISCSKDFIFFNVTLERLGSLFLSTLSFSLLIKWNLGNIRRLNMRLLKNQLCDVCMPWLNMIQCFFFLAIFLCLPNITVYI